MKPAQIIVRQQSIFKETLDMEAYTFGRLNGHSTGIIMKELVRRAITIIRNQRQSFEATVKQGYDGNMNDVFTSADNAAQEIYIKSLRECFPDIGIIAEEESLSITATEGVSAYFTVDPLDGTKAFIRRQSSGVGSMIALVFEGKVIAAFIGDTNTQEIYGFRPGSKSVRRITEFNNSERLTSGKRAPLIEQYVILRDRESAYSAQSRKLIDSCFKNVAIDGGSIGTWFARLWKREVAAALLPPSWETPWDSAPTVGISLTLGYVFLRPSPDGWEEYDPIVSPEKYKRTHETLVIHRDDLAGFHMRAA
ncbi:MAG: inositol monophosphatase family protein [Candidatus Paceibacterota bacterium]